MPHKPVICGSARPDQHDAIGINKVNRAPKQLMIYESAVPVSRERHGNVYVDVGSDYAFSRHVNSVPLMATEFANAALEYPVVFGETGAVVIPAAVLGLRADENLYVGKQGG